MLVGLLSQPVFAFGCSGSWLHSQIRSWLLLGVNQLLKMQRLRSQKTGKEELEESASLSASQQAVSGRGWGRQNRTTANHQRDSREDPRTSGTSCRKVRGGTVPNLNPAYNLTTILLI